jgi:cation:H+ antiporter
VWQWFSNGSTLSRGRDTIAQSQSLARPGLPLQLQLAPGSVNKRLMWLQVFLLLAGLALIVKGGGWFVSAAVRLAELLRMPRVVIGSTLVSLATTSPELVVSIMAGIRKEPGLAVGNAVGSCLCNIGLILGLTAALKQVDVHAPALRRPLLAMFSLGALVFLMTLDLVMNRWQGLVLILLGAGYFLWDFIRHAQDREPGDLVEAETIKRELAAGGGWFMSTRGTIVQFLLGAGVVVVGSRLLVDSAVHMAVALGVPSIIIGLTLVAVGTSLPELVTAISSSRQNVSDLAVGNVIGANIANLSLVVGTAASLHPLQMDRLTQLFNFPAMLVAMLLLLWTLSSDRRVTRREGCMLLAFYGSYLSILVAITFATRGA